METNGKATKALSLADRLCERIDGMRSHFDERFDRIDAHIEKTDDRHDGLAKEFAELKTCVAVLKSEFRSKTRWAVGLTGTGSAGLTAVVLELLRRAP